MNLHPDSHLREVFFEELLGAFAQAVTGGGNVLQHEPDRATVFGAPFQVAVAIQVPPAEFGQHLRGPFGVVGVLPNVRIVVRVLEVHPAGGRRLQAVEEGVAQAAAVQGVENRLAGFFLVEQQVFHPPDAAKLVYIEVFPDRPRNRPDVETPLGATGQLRGARLFQAQCRPRGGVHVAAQYGHQQGIGVAYEAVGHLANVLVCTARRGDEKARVAHHLQAAAGPALQHERAGVDEGPVVVGFGSGEPGHELLEAGSDGGGVFFGIEARERRLCLPPLFPQHVRRSQSDGGAAQVVGVRGRKADHEVPGVQHPQRDPPPV